MLAFILTTTCRAEVELILNNTHYSFPTNPRLVDALNPIALQEQWYWPQSKLFKTNTNRSQVLRGQIIKMLRIESASNNTRKSSYQNLINQINAWKVADRVNINIDFELARISLSDNPRFEDGQYRMILSKRPTQLHVFGAVNSAVDLPYPNNTCLKDILSNVSLADIADNSHVYLISPQGKAEKFPSAYWNSELCTMPMPGSSIYVPLQESLFSKVPSTINTQIAELAVNRINDQ